MAQATTRQTEMADYIRQMHKVADNLPHEIDRIQMKRAIVGLKKELNVEYAMGERNCPVRKKRLKKAISDVRDALEDVRSRNQIMRIEISLDKARINKPTVIWIHSADDLYKSDQTGVSSGYQRSHHLYIERRGTPGNYRYIYYDPDKKNYYHTAKPQHQAYVKGVGLQNHQQTLTHQDEHAKLQQQSQKPTPKSPTPSPAEQQTPMLKTPAGAEKPAVGLPEGHPDRKPLSVSHGRAEDVPLEKVTDEHVKAYTKEFTDIAPKFSKKFNELVSTDVEKIADDLIASGKTNAYNITKYSVYHNSDFKALMGKQKQLSVTMYNVHPEYTEGMLAEVRKKVGDVPYVVSERASKFHWEDGWTEDPEVEYVEVGRNKKGERAFVAKAPEHNVTFEPESEEQAKGIAEAVRLYQGRFNVPEGQNTNHPKGTIKEKYGWKAPDNRTNMPLDGYKQVYLNYKPVGDKTITVMTKANSLHGHRFGGYKSAPIYCNPEVEEYLSVIKSLLLVIDLSKSHR